MVAVRTAPSRLPGSAQPPRNRALEVVRGVLALLAITVIVVGVPLALYTAFGTPWPDTAPSSDWIYADFGPTQALMVLVAVTWLAWLHFVACLVVEALNEWRGRGLSPRVPGGSAGAQPIARRLVGAVLLLSAGMTVAAPTATALTTSDTASSAGVAPNPQRESQADGTGVGSPGRVKVEAHHGTPAFTDARAGVQHKYVEVQPPEGRHYDTMWGIAERYLGDGMRYREIAALNVGVVQPDGTRLQNPDLIYPGWILRLPADAKGPGLHDVAQPVTPPPSQHGGSHSGRPPAEDPPHQSGSGALSDPHGNDGASAEQGSQEQSDTASVLTATGVSAGGVLLAAGLIYSLRRRRGWDGQPPPRGGRPLDREVALRESADETSAVFVDRVLRSLGRSLTAEAKLDLPVAVALGVDGLALTFVPGSRVRLSEPWQSDSSESTWLIRRSDVAQTQPLRSGLAPWPGLVALGTSADAVETLFDVESVAGIVSVSGDLDMARDITVGIGLGLATNRWADMARVTFVGFADDLSGVAPQRIRHQDDLSRVFDMIEARQRRQHGACTAAGYESVAAGRLADPDLRLWAPEFLVLSGVPAPADVDRLTALAENPRTAVGVIVVGDVREAAVRMVATPEGRLWSGPLGIDVEAHRMSAEAYRDALSVFDAEVRRGHGPGDPDTPAGGALPARLDPAALDLAAPMPVEITTLGQVQVTAPGPVDESRRAALTEIVVFLALHPAGVHPHVLAAAIWPRGVSDEVRDSALAQTAQWLGLDERGEPRLAIDGDGRWALSASGVRFDWDVVRALANRSARTGSAIGDLEQALSLVRGPAWSDLPATRYAWLAYQSVEVDMRVAVVALSRRLAQLATAAGNPTRARDALLTGLVSAPDCELLWRDVLQLAHRFAAKADVEAVAVDMYAAIARFGSPRGAEPETDALVDELLPSFRRSNAA